MKQHQTISVDLYGMTGYGPTKAEAKQDAKRRVTAAMDGSYTPCVFRFPAGYAVIVTRCHPRWHAQKWEYFYMGPGEDQSPATPSTCSAYDTPAEAERALRRHVAQLLIWVIEDNGMSVLLDEKELRAQGYSDTDAHRMACDGRAWLDT